MQTTVHIKGAKFYAFHGFYPEERKKGNQFELDVSVSLSSFDQNDDDINDTVDYQELYKICQAEMKQTQKLLETVLFNICTKIKKAHPLIKKGKVALKKIGPQMGGPVEATIVEMAF